MSNTLAFKQLQVEFLQGLELETTRVYPLPGAWGRPVYDDPRISDWAKSDKVCYYEHIATIRHAPTKQFFVAFRETMQAFLARQRDLTKYPKWLINTKEKQHERQIYIYLVTNHPTKIPNLKSHEEWLCPLANDEIFDAIAYFLTSKKVIDEGILSKGGL